jgi:hypothetical protein
MKYSLKIILVFLIQNLSSQNLDTTVIYWKNTKLIKEKIIKSDLFVLPIKKIYFNKKQDVVKMDTLMYDSIIFSYEYKKGKIRNQSVIVLNEKKRYFCIYDSMGHYRYIAYYNNDTLYEEIGIKFNINNLNYDTFYYYKRFNINLFIYYSNYGYLLTTYKYKRLKFTFDYYNGDSITRIRKSNIDFKKLKRYNYTIEEVFNNLNKFFPMTRFVMYDDNSKEKRRNILPRN